MSFKYDNHNRSLDALNKASAPPIYKSYKSSPTVPNANIRHSKLPSQLIKKKSEDEDTSFRPTLGSSTSLQAEASSLSGLRSRSSQNLLAQNHPSPLTLDATFAVPNVVPSTAKAPYHKHTAKSSSLQVPISHPWSRHPDLPVKLRLDTSESEAENEDGDGDEDAIPYAAGHSRNDSLSNNHDDLIRIYVHVLKKTDSLPFLLLAYGISASALRKANRLWPNDSIHLRQELKLPVADCSVKVTPWEPDHLIDLTNGETTDSSKVSLRKSRSSSGDHGSTSDSYWDIPKVGKTRLTTIPSHQLTFFPPASSSPTRPRLSALTNGNPPSSSLSLDGRPRSARPSHDSVQSNKSTGSLINIGQGLEEMVGRAWRGYKNRKWERSSLEESHELRRK